MTLRVAGSAVLVAVLLVVWFAVAGSDDADLATDAPFSSTTTSTPSTTSSTALPNSEKLLRTPSSATAERNGSSVSDDDFPEPRDNRDRADVVAADNTNDTPSAGPAAVQIPRPACASNVGSASTRTAPFTGLSASIPSNMPAVLVKVSNNSSASRAALIGVDQADIVFEERIEASATRFAAVFHSTMPANVGPVRSGRTTDIQITQNLNRPVMGYSGSNQGVARQIKFAADNGLLVPYVNTDAAPFARDGRYSAPDNLFVDPAALGGCGGGGSPTPIFSYGPASSTTAQGATSVSLSARTSYRFDWNGSGWVRSQGGFAHTTRTGAAIAPTNVVVLFVPYVQSVIDAASVDAETIGSGSAWIFRDGTVTQGSWSRAKGHLPYSLTDANGGATNLAPGQTWVVLAPAGSASWS